MSAGPAHSHPDHQTGVVICDRREFDRAALRALCSHRPDLVVVAEIERLDELSSALPEGTGGVILVGRSVLREHGSEQLRELRRRAPAARVVVVGMSGERGPATAAALGADAFLQRDGDLAGQLAAVYGV